MERFFIAASILLASYIVWPDAWHSRLQAAELPKIARFKAEVLPMNLNGKVYNCTEVKIDKQLTLEKR